MRFQNISRLCRTPTYSDPFVNIRYCMNMTFHNTQVPFQLKTLDTVSAIVLFYSIDLARSHQRTQLYFSFSCGIVPHSPTRSLTTRCNCCQFFPTQPPVILTMLLDHCKAGNDFANLRLEPCTSESSRINMHSNLTACHTITSCKQFNGGVLNLFVKSNRVQVHLERLKNRQQESQEYRGVTKIPTVTGVEFIYKISIGRS